MTDTGVNLLAPSSKPKETLRFLTFLMNTVKAVHDHADLLRASIASAGNEYRLGANEAPPAIVSIFLGDELIRLLETLENRGEIQLEKGDNVFYKLGITRTPPLMRDNTDRNRTSPFAFTGNKFEYRAVGGSANSASPMIILNTIVANQLQEFKKELEVRLETGEKKELAIVDILKDYYRHSKRILFQGNGYSEEWIQEAANRGLTNIASTPIALAKYIEPSAIAVLEKMGVLTEREVHARYEIELENYIKKVQIESRVIGDLALNHVVSTTIKYQFQLAQTAKALVELELIDEAQPLKELIKEVSQRVSIIKQAVDDMTEARKKANNTEDIAERAILYGSEVKDYFDKIRYEVDKLELLIDDEDWPLVKYREMLFVK